ncbi:MAG: hypothetical protein AAGD07_11325 [Planctomycetota bacterium]
MNFLAHALPYLSSDPLVAVATGIPDWLSVIDRRVRARRKMAIQHVGSDDPVLARVARGIVAHVDDDQWFHSGALFTRLNMEQAVALRNRLPGDAGFRPSFVAHIGIEMLIDSNFIEARRDVAEDYYLAVSEIDAESMTRAIETITGQQINGMRELLKRFTASRFLFDYVEDAGLLNRINQVLARVTLPPLPADTTSWIQDLRVLVRQNMDELLTPEGAAMQHPTVRWASP